MKTTIPFTAVLAVIALHVIPCSARAAVPDRCKEIARAARNACENETRDDYWIAIGNCSNLADDAARRPCRATARDTSGTSTHDCRDQYDARLALCAPLGPAPYAPPIQTARFVSPQAAAANPNPFFPLVPGNTWVYQGGGETITVVVTNQTKTIQGIVAFVVSDVVTVGGVPHEETLDYFAQDVDGTVWYLGESVQNFENGDLVNVDGSFVHGTDNALGGILMKATRTVGDVYRQEFALGEAEDAGEILDLAASESVPGGSCAGTCVVTRDFSPLDPGNDEHKYYAPGIGLILEVDVDGGLRTELQSFIPGP